MAVKISPEVLNAVLDLNGEMAEIVSLPGDGVSSLAISLLKELSDNNDKIALYLFCADSGMNLEMMKKLGGQNIIFSTYEINNLDNILISVDIFGLNKVEYIVIDDFVRLILHRNRQIIKKFINQLSALCVKHNLNIILVNQYRYNLKNEFGSPGIYRILYQNILESHLSLGIDVYKENEIDIVAEIIFNKNIKKNNTDNDILELTGLNYE